MKILHVAAIRISKESGMGRIAYNWQQAFERNGHEFIHIGLDECPKHIHPLLWGRQAYQYVKEKMVTADAILVHEPAAGYFTHLAIPTVVVSHGIEPRGWDTAYIYGFRKRSFKALFLPHYLRFWSNTEGLKKASKIFICNNEDRDYVVKNYNRLPSDVLYFKNGYYENSLEKTKKPSPVTTFLFNATWLDRKGIGVLIAAFMTIKKQFPSEWHLVLAGVGYPEEVIYEAFPSDLKDNITVLPHFKQIDEAKLYQESDVFILPSYIEGQSLALTQAMASGLCCIVSDNCGQRDFVQHQHNGLLFKTGDAADLAQQIKHVLLHKNSIKIYGNAAYESVKDLTWQNVSNDVVTVCKNLVLAAKKQEKTVEKHPESLKY
jgi:glycosyltransferase involved in cell wall biosynthesis